MNQLAPIEAGGLQFHPLANIFPLIQGDEFEELVADVAEHGVRESIWLYEGMILDGRNRYRAAIDAEVDCPSREYRGSDPVGFVISLNLKRRHLTESQRAMVAGRLANLEHGVRADRPANLPVLGEAPAPVTQSTAAGMLNVSERSVRDAKTVQRDAIPEIQKAVEDGALRVSAAAKIAKQDHDTQRRLAAEDKLKRAASDLRKAEKAARDAEALPKPEPITPEQKAEQARVFGSQEDRAIGARLDEIIERVSEQPPVPEAVSRIPPAERHTINVSDIRAAARWLDAFADAWELEQFKQGEAEDGLEAAE